MRSLDREIPWPSASSSSNSLSEEDRSVVCSKRLACGQVKGGGLQLYVRELWRCHL